VIGRQRQAEALVAEHLELLPGGNAGVALHDIIPLLRGSCEMERSQPHLVGFVSELRPEKNVRSG
jgi:hypothetical protein